jgi:NAD(P)-dependent dehydrogenase (short-subunit alcohol dehydrogenase family)
MPAPPPPPTIAIAGNFSAGASVIRVCGVAPGPIWTPLQVSGGASMEKLEKFGSMSSFGRPGQPAELASIYAQLASSDASYTTGAI